MAGMESGKFPRTPNCTPRPASPTAATASRITTARVSAPSAMPMPCALQQHVLLSGGRRGQGSMALKQAADQLGFSRRPALRSAGRRVWGWSEISNGPIVAAGLGRARHGALDSEDMASASIGQSVVQITPLQLARAYAVFANGGWLVTPHFPGEPSTGGSPIPPQGGHASRPRCRPFARVCARWWCRRERVLDSMALGFRQLPGRPAPLKTAPVGPIMPGSAVMPLIPTGRSWWSLLPRTLRAEGLFMPCRWPRRCWRSGRRTRLGQAAVQSQPVSSTSR